MVKGAKLAIENDALAISLLILWSFCLLLTLINSYLYLFKLNKYKVMPLLILLVGMVILCSIVLVFYIECVLSDSKINSNESAWLFFMINMKLCYLLTIIGFSGLIIDLLLMINLMVDSSQIFSAAQREQLHQQH